MNDRMRQQRVLERKRALRRKRRKQQIIRRMLLAAVATVLVLTAAIKILSGPRKGERTAQLGQVVNPGQAYSTSTMSEGTYSQLGKKQRNEVCIVLDAGHGGKDSGTLWKSVYEKDINLTIVEKLEALLKEAGYQVIMTRSDDSRIVLKDRVKAAQDNQADIFVSVHQNALENDTVTNGIETYCSKQANIQSPSLAEAIHSALLGKTGARNLGVKTDSDFYVVENTTMPSCLVETGFLTEASEREKLLDDGYQTKIAEGIAEGIEQFLEEFVLAG